MQIGCSRSPAPQLTEYQIYVGSPCIAHIVHSAVDTNGRFSMTSRRCRPPPIPTGPTNPTNTGPPTTSTPPTTHPPAPHPPTPADPPPGGRAHTPGRISMKKKPSARSARQSTGPLTRSSMHRCRYQKEPYPNVMSPAYRFSDGSPAMARPRTAQPEPGAPKQVVMFLQGVAGFDTRGQSQAGFTVL